MEYNVSMTQNGVLLKTAHEADIREMIEDMFSERFEFTPSLAEYTADEEYEIYLHTDSYEDLDEQHLILLHSLGITDDPSSTDAIKKLFNLEFELVEEWQFDNQEAF